MQVRIEELENELSLVISAKSKLNEGYKQLQRIIAEKDSEIRRLKKRINND